MSRSLSEDIVNQITSFPDQSSPVPHGQYAIKALNGASKVSKGPNIEIETWFKSPALTRDTISRITSLQLFAETHDQGRVDDPTAGNWTWLEVAILANDTAKYPKRKGGLDLVWRSHPNRFQTNEFGWAEGAIFEETHDLLSCLEPDNVIAVRLCSRFLNWKIVARNGYLILDIGQKPVNREPPQYRQVVDEIKNINSIIHEVNAEISRESRPLPDNFFIADTFGGAGERPLRVLSLDGGGVRGLSSLHILKAVMSKAAPGKKPHEVFDMIGGTSTGGLIAIMLGSLKMGIDECIGTYERFMGSIFNPNWAVQKAKFAATGAMHDTEALESVIKELVKERLGNAEAPLLDENQQCKVFLLAVRKEGGNNRAPVILRSYTNPQDKSLLSKIKIWEAARATSAAPAYFKSITIDNKYELIDGGLAANNPLGWLWTEILTVFGAARPTNCFLSIGTGIPRNQVLDIGLVGSITHDAEAGFAGYATNTEIVHILFRNLLDSFAPHAMSKKYWRLNVSKEIGDWEERTGILKLTKIQHHDDYQDLGKFDDVGAVKQLLEMTDKYVRDQQKVIDDCAGALRVS